MLQLFIHSFIYKISFYYVAQTGLELTHLVPQLPKCQDYKPGPPHLADIILNHVKKPKSSEGIHSTGCRDKYKTTFKEKGGLKNTKQNNKLNLELTKYN